MMAPSSGSSASRDVPSDRVPKEVRETRVEIDRLIQALVDDEYPGESKGLSLDDLDDEVEERAPLGAVPVHLIISSRRALAHKYGESGFEELHSDLRQLKYAVEATTDLEVVIAYVDDEASLARFGLKPVDSTNPWQVKKLVDSLDARVAEQGAEVRYLLIVGGDAIIPFHRLPNPIDDQDPDVPSDNPYASRDANYLVPERATGRLPDGQDEDVGFLRTLIQTAVEAHSRTALSKGLLGTLSNLFSGIARLGGNGHGLGYSASIWRKASRAVFHVIGDDGRLRTCPPLTYEGFQVVEPPHLSYFNLHGIENGPNWYGQRDALFPADYPLFPLALRPEDPSITEHVNAVVFTEACYGANTLGKNQADSIALRLLGVGALGVVGSTKISYGSIAPPLLGADLMGKHFWQGLRARLRIGEALRHAKVTMASEMQEQQGFLDDEDQKALISFVLYGDPSLPVTSIHTRSTSGVSAGSFCPPIICSKRAGTESDAEVRPVSDELVAKVKARIETSLPHMSHASVRAKPLSVCGSTSKAGSHLVDEVLANSRRSAMQRRRLSGNGWGWAVTLRKDITIGGDGAHRQVVKVVVDESGHILKMALSK